MKKFIYGLLFGLMLIPILHEITSFIINLFEIPKATITKKIIKENKLIYDLHDELEQEEISTNVCGFVYHGDDDYEDTDYEDED